MTIKPSPIECDVCSIEKKSVNHWWWVRLDGSRFVSGSLKTQKVAGAEDRHACGSDHAGILYQRFMATGKLDKEMHPETQAKPIGLTEAGILGKEPEIEKEEEGRDNQNEVQASEAGRQEAAPTPVN